MTTPTRSWRAEHAHGVQRGRAVTALAAMWMFAAAIALALFAPRPGGAPTGVHLVAVPLLALAGVLLFDRCGRRRT